jgi:hypothetical protein
LLEAESNEAADESDFPVRPEPLRNFLDLQTQSFLRTDARLADLGLY